MVVTEKDILESICKIMKDRARATFDLDDLITVLVRSGKINAQNLSEEKRLISRKLSELVKKNILKISGRGLYKITDNYWNIAKSKNIECYKNILDYINNYLEFNKNKAIKTLSEIQDEILGLEAANIRLAEFYGKLIMLDSEIRRIIKEAIDDIVRSNPNPKKLLIEMLNDYVEMYDELVERISLTIAGNERERLIKQSEELLRIITIIFGRVLSIPISRESTCRQCPIILPKDPGKGRIQVNLEILVDLLEKRIIDDKFFVEEEVRSPIADFVGIDTSVAEIDLRIGPFAFMRHLPPINIFTAIEAIRRGRNGNRDVNIYPRPEKITSEDLKKLEDEKDVLPADVLYRYDEYYIPRIKEAIMQSKEYQIINSIPDRIPMIAIIYKDGAIWPTERKFYDFLYDHKKFVIDNLIEYHKMVKNISDSVPVVGVVKRGHLGFLWYLINWYIVRKMNKVDVKDLSKFVTFLERQRSSDGYLALLMLSRYADIKNLRDKGIRLFAIRRSLYSTDETFTVALLEYAEKENKKVVDLEKSESVWKEIVWSLLIHHDKVSKGSELRRLLKGDLDVLRTEEYWQDLAVLLKTNGMIGMDIRDPLDYVSIYRILAKEGREDILKSLLSEESQKVYSKLPYLLAHADIIFFYYLPPYDQSLEFIRKSINESRELALPRFEIQLNETIQNVKNLISKISVMPFSQFYVHYDRKEHVDRDLIVPVPIKDAHLYAKGEAKEISKVFLSVLLKAIREYLNEGEVNGTEE